MNFVQEFENASQEIEVAEFKTNVEIELIDKMGSDQRLAEAAWVSSAQEYRNSAFGIGLPEGKTDTDVQKLISFLIAHRHGTPFEHSTLQFFVHAPIFVWREWHRHRIGMSYNEESGRYKRLRPIFYMPDINRPMIQLDGWKPGRPKFKTLEQHVRDTNEELKDVKIDDPKHDLLIVEVRKIYDEFINDTIACSIADYQIYDKRLSQKFDPGLARINMPVNLFSGCYVTMNPRSLMHFLSLRTHEPEATYPSYPLFEIELAARLIEIIFAKHWPVTYEAFNRLGRVAP